MNILFNIWKLLIPIKLSPNGEENTNGWCDFCGDSL